MQGHEFDFSAMFDRVNHPARGRDGGQDGAAGIVALPDGTYLAKHDEFGPGSTEKTNAITRVYRSVDRGRSWEPVSRIEGSFWANLFYHRGPST